MNGKALPASNLARVLREGRFAVAVEVTHARRSQCPVLFLPADRNYCAATPTSTTLPTTIGRMSHGEPADLYHAQAGRVRAGSAESPAVTGTAWRFRRICWARPPFGINTALALERRLHLRWDHPHDQKPVYDHDLGQTWFA
jgi:hypothetical protein